MDEIAVRILEALPIPAFLIDATDPVVRLNGAAQASVGSRAPRGGDWVEALGIELGAEVRSAWHETAGRGEVFETVARIRDADGSLRVHDVRIVPVWEAGAGRTWLGTLAPVGPCPREAPLAGSSERLRLTVENSASLGSLDLSQTLRELTWLVVPTLADWCAVYLIDSAGSLRAAAFAHHEEELRQAIDERFARDPSYDIGGAQAVLRTRAAAIVRRSPGDDEAGGDDLATRLRLRSILSVPLETRAILLGVLQIGRADAAHGFSDADRRDLDALAARAAVALDHARLYEHERLIANTFQQAALPMSMPLVPDVVFDATYEPAEDDTQVGGDWYDATRLADGRIVLSVGDVSGSGLASAVLMTSMRQILRGVAQIYADPLAMIEAADRTLKLEYPGSMVTAFVAVYDPIDRRLTYASAGHPPALVRHPDGAVVELSSVDLPLGLRSRTSHPAGVAHIPDGSLLVFYTDGLIEATRDVVEGMQRLRDGLAALDRPNPQRAAHELRDLVLDRRSKDDVVVFTMFVSSDMAPAASTSVDSHLVRWTFDSDDAQSGSNARRAFVAALRAGGAREIDLFSAELVFGELLGNVVRHAPGRLEVVLDWSNIGSPILHMLDRGPGFLVLPRLPSDLLSERGRGLYLVWMMTDDFNVTPRGDGGSHARAVLRVFGRTHVASPLGRILLDTALYPFEKSE